MRPLGDRRAGALLVFAVPVRERMRSEEGSSLEDWINPQQKPYHGFMTSFRISVTVLAVIHAAFVGLTSLVGAFANGGDVWQRLLLVLLHPLGAAGVLLLVLRPRLAATPILALVALMTANVIADLGLAQLIAEGSVRGDWELALAFSVVPAIGIIYGLALLLTARGPAE